MSRESRCRSRMSPTWLRGLHHRECNFLASHFRLPIPVRSRRQDDDERYQPFPPEPAHEDGHPVQRTGGGCARRADGAVPVGFDHQGTRERLPRLGFARPRRPVSRGRDAPRYLPQSLRDADRWQDGRYGVLGTARRGREVPGARGELYAPGVSGALVPAVRFVPVPVPWRSLLSRRFARRGSTRARIGRVSVQGRERNSHHPGGRAAHAGIHDRACGRAADMRLISRIGEWFDQRLQIAAPVREMAEHPVPRSTASWWYVFGSAALVVFILQLATGILLAFIY